MQHIHVYLVNKNSIYTTFIAYNLFIFSIDMHKHIHVYILNINSMHKYCEAQTWNTACCNAPVLFVFCNPAFREIIVGFS